MSEAEWRFIPGYEGFYQASASGEIRSVARWVKYPKGGMMKRKGVLLKQTGTMNGYKMVALTKEGKALYYNVHRLVAMTFIPNPEGKPQVNHIDGNKDNNTPNNLEWVTTKEHGKDRREKGQVTKLKGSQCPPAKLTEETVRSIRGRLRGGESGSRIAKELGMGEGSISRIENNKSWKHVV